MKGDLLKKFFAVFLICGMPLFAACQAKLPPPPSQNFTAQAHVTFGEKSFTAALEQACPGSLRLEFAGLPELEGMSMQLEGGTAIVRYGDMELTMPTPSLPQAGFAGVLGEALRQLAQPEEANVRRVTGGWEVNGTADGLAYTVRVDMEGIPRSLYVPGATLKAEFT